MGYLSSADLLPSLQSGFRQGHSTETAVLRVLSDILQAGRYSEHLESCELQFGFSPKRWAAMCTMMLKETVSYYVKNSSNVYCTFWMLPKPSIESNIVSYLNCLWIVICQFMLSECCLICIWATDACSLEWYILRKFLCIQWSEARGHLKPSFVLCLL